MASFPEPEIVEDVIDLETKVEENGQQRVRVFTGMPAYLYTDPRAVMGATAFASAVKGRTSFRVMASSLPAGNFNALWCAARNTFERERWTHFACLHQDVQPEPWWVDRGVEIMDREGLDFLSVVLLIKEEKRITSTAILDKEKLCTRRLVMREIKRYLPRTFRSSDLAVLGHKNHLLLGGSGMWIARMDPRWFRKVWFEAPSRILDDAAGNAISSVWDEGWNFNLQLEMLGLRCACTWDIPAIHHGGGSWSNQDDDSVEPWDTDGAWTDYSWILGKP